MPLNAIYYYYIISTRLTLRGTQYKHRYSDNKEELSHSSCTAKSMNENLYIERGF